MNFNKACFLAAVILFPAISGAAEPTARFGSLMNVSVQEDLAAYAAKPMAMSAAAYAAKPMAMSAAAYDAKPIAMSAAAYDAKPIAMSAAAYAAKPMAISAATYAAKPMAISAATYDATHTTATDLDKSDAESDKLLRSNGFWLDDKIAAATDLGVPDKSDAESEKSLRGNGFLTNKITLPIDGAAWKVAWFSDASPTIDVVESSLGG